MKRSKEYRKEVGLFRMSNTERAGKLKDRQKEEIGDCAAVTEYQIYLWMSQGWDEEKIATEYRQQFERLERDRMTQQAEDHLQEQQRDMGSCPRVTLELVLE